MSDINDPLKSAGRDDHELVLEAIESLKRWVYRADYKGPDKEPEPKTEEEFSLLMDGLRRWATLHAPHIDTGRLQDYRRAEFGLPNPCGSARLFSDQLGERQWWQAAHKADDALNELKILLKAETENKKSKRTPLKEAEEKEALAGRVASLEARLAELASYLQLALQYLTSDPQSSLTKARIILEKVLLALYRRAMKKEPKRPMIGEMLSDKVFTARIPRRIVARMNAIRDMSNLGPHAEAVEPTDAVRVMRDLLEVLEWYVVKYDPSSLVSSRQKQSRK
jgi:hypothetical protein